MAVVTQRGSLAIALVLAIIVSSSGLFGCSSETENLSTAPSGLDPLSPRESSRRSLRVAQVAQALTEHDDVDRTIELARLALFGRDILEPLEASAARGDVPIERVEEILSLLLLKSIVREDLRAFHHLDSLFRKRAETAAGALGVLRTPSIWYAEAADELTHSLHPTREYQAVVAIYGLKGFAVPFLVELGHSENPLARVYAGVFLCQLLATAQSELVERLARDSAGFETWFGHYRGETTVAEMIRGSWGSTRAYFRRESRQRTGMTAGSVEGEHYIWSAAAIVLGDPEVVNLLRQTADLSSCPTADDYSSRARHSLSSYRLERESQPRGPRP